MTDKEKKELEVTEKKAIAPSDGEPTREGIMYTPQVDIIEDPEAITLYADLPGIARDDVTIDVQEGVLTLMAAAKPTSPNWQMVWREYDVGGYSRRFTLSNQIDTAKIDAKFENGVLKLVLPKAESQKPRKIKVG